MIYTSQIKEIFLRREGPLQRSDFLPTLLVHQKLWTKGLNEGKELKTIPRGAVSTRWETIKGKRRWMSTKEKDVFKSQTLETKRVKE